MNLIKRGIHKIRRTIQRIVLSTKLDKNQSPILEKLEFNNITKDLLTIIRKILSDETTFINHSKRKSITNIYNKDFSILIDENTVKISNNDFVYLININYKTYLYIEWLINKRVEINFNKQFYNINKIEEKQINKLLKILK